MAKRRQPTAKAGKKLGRYVIERELGRGGMGVVYVAKDENLGRHVALKTTNVSGMGSGARSRNQRRQRFIREVKALAQVNHHNVVHVYDAGEADDPELGWLLFYSMQFVEGITLAQLVQKSGALTPGAAAAVCMQVALGLGAAHQQGIVHRDVKPANIFTTKDGRALIGDFGICKIEGSTSITRRDQLIGTPNYLAPEQILGEAITPATDVFALGALFYVIATNRPLRDRTDAASLLAEAPTNAPRDKVKGERSIPEGLRRIIVKSLERDPKKRFVDGGALAEALSDFATRIPSENDAKAKAPAKALDAATSPFGSLKMTTSSTPPSSEESAAAENLVGTGSAGIDAVAQALLNEVEQSGKLIKSPQKADALPVARAESTVMFNLRQVEQEGAKDLAPKKRSLKDLPVATAESTVVFNIKKMQEEQEPAPRQPPAAEPALTEETSPPFLSDDTPLGDTLEPAPLGGEEDDFAESTATHAPPAAQVDAADAHPTAPDVVAKPKKPAKKAKPPKQPKPPKVKKVREGPSPVVRLAKNAGPLLRRYAHIFVGAAGGLFAALFIVGSIALIRSPERGAIRPAISDVDVDNEAAAVLPPLCATAAKSKKAVSKSKKALVRAKAAAEADDTAAAMAAVDAALKLDPQSSRAHYLRAQLIGAEDISSALESYRCVVELAPDSSLAQKARAVMKRFSKAKRNGASE